MLQSAMALQEQSVANFAGVFRHTPRKQKTVSHRQNMLKVTWSSVELDGGQLANERFDLSVSTVVEALKTARSNDRDELLINDIAPDMLVGSADITEIQEIIEQIVREACARIGREAPEMRLSLRGSAYDIRCYLGRRKPTDYLFDPDA